MKHTLKQLLSLIVTSVTLPMAIHAIMPDEAVFHNQATDTLKINELLIKAIEIKNPQERVAVLAREFLDTPYVAGTLEGDGEERVRVNIDEVDCTTLVDNVLALAYTAGEGRTSWRDFVYNLENMRYRSGSLSGYGSRLHYFSDWVVDNVHRGNIKEYTSHMPSCSWEIKTIDYMSSHKDLYPALADSTEYARIKNAEIGYRNHRYPFIKASHLNKAVAEKLQDGDVIAITTKTPGLDVTHMGIIVKKNGTPYLLHASSRQGKVIIDDLSLAEYLKKNGGTGFRIIRLAD